MKPVQQCSHGEKRHFIWQNGVTVVSQDTFLDSQNKKTLHYGGLDARMASFLTELFSVDSDSVSRSWTWRKRRFQHTQEILCEKKDTAAQATSAIYAKRYVRKIVHLPVCCMGIMLHKSFCTIWKIYARTAFAIQTTEKSLTSQCSATLRKFMRVLGQIKCACLLSSRTTWQRRPSQILMEEEGQES